MGDVRGLWLVLKERSENKSSPASFLLNLHFEATTLPVSIN